MKDGNEKEKSWKEKIVYPTEESFWDIFMEFSVLYKTKLIWTVSPNTIYFAGVSESPSKDC